VYVAIQMRDGLAGSWRGGIKRLAWAVDQRLEGVATAPDSDSTARRFGGDSSSPSAGVEKSTRRPCSPDGASPNDDDDAAARSVFMLVIV